MAVAVAAAQTSAAPAMTNIPSAASCLLFTPSQLVFGELASEKRNQGRPLKRFKDCVKASKSHANIIPKELEPRAHDRTGWRALTRHAMDTFEERRCTQMEEARERRKASADAPGNPGPVCTTR